MTKAQKLALILVGLNCLDLLTTYKALNIGGVEANPIGRWLLDHNLLLEVKIGIPLAVFAAVTIWKYVRMTGALSICVATYTLVVAWNTIGILKYQ
jgi:hypothetical protein